MYSIRLHKRVFKNLKKIVFRKKSPPNHAKNIHVTV